MPEAPARYNALGTPQAGARPMSKARTCPGVDADGFAETEADDFMKCPGRGEWFDMRDLAQTLAHVHNGEIEIGEERDLPREAPLQSRVKRNPRASSAAGRRLVRAFQRAGFRPTRRNTSITPPPHIP